jgi:putative DNA methylase
MTDKRLIEVAFPLQQTSLDSVHEKNVRHGHISTLHIWPARRPLAACRAALIATLLPDSGDPIRRKDILSRLAGKLVAKDVKKTLPSGKTEIVKTFETMGGILHWGRESGPDLDWFREEIKKAYGGRAPKVLDPFAGGGAIPLEAMRLGCDVTAVDINPVAWFLLKCTLEYPQKLVGQKRRLPSFAIADRNFMEAFLTSQKLKGAALRTQLTKLFGEDDAPKQHQAFDDMEPLFEADLAWHVRAWGQWVLKKARKELAAFYPTYSSYEAIDGSAQKAKEGTLELVPLNAEGIADVSILNREFSRAYLDNPTKPRWIAKPTVAYLWARTVSCKNCRATIPLIKTRWICKQDKRRVVLELNPKADKSGVEFSILREAPVVGQNAAARREHDKRLGAGTMSRSGAKCPCCSTIMTMEDIRLEGRAGRLGTTMTSVVVDGLNGKDYRLPTAVEIAAADSALLELPNIFEEVPFGLPIESLASAEALGFRVPLYGLDRWDKLFLPRQLAAIGILVKAVRSISTAADSASYGPVWLSALTSYAAIALDRAANYLSTICIWEPVASEVKQTFLRFALPITWDFGEGNPLSTADRYFSGGISNVASVLDNTLRSLQQDGPVPNVKAGSAIQSIEGEFDVILTDPPYYDAIPYSDLMDFFYIWLRRTMAGLGNEFDSAFRQPLAPKWDANANDGELIDDSSRFAGDKEASKKNYEDGMARAFIASHAALRADGRFVIVFAHKHPDAWETLVSAIIRAGFVVDGSWPIMTEMRGGVRNFGRASLSSSVWLVCRKRSETARPGWDNRVLSDMHGRITTQLRDFWDAGIRGPDFVWAATGPALEAYSQHPVVKKANSPGELMNVAEFLQHVRRIVVDFVVGRVLSANSERSDEASGLDDLTTYYLLHRHDFEFDDAPAGACILYAVSCGLSDRELSDQYDLVSRVGGGGSASITHEDDEASVIEGEDEPRDRGSGSALRLKAWNQRKATDLGLDAPRGKTIPLIDQVHRIMRLWKVGDVVKVNEYLDLRALRSNQVFHQLLQALIELAPHASEERSLLESISNHVAARGVATQDEMNVYSAE